MTCPNCESTNVTERTFTDNFRYGFPPNEVLLSAVCPLLECRDCGQAWTDDRGEEARTAVVAQHINSRRESKG